MGKKKNLKGLSVEDLSFINDKMGYGIDDKNTISYVNYSKVLDYKLNLKCKNQKQKELYKLIKEKEIVFCSGTFGTGKSYIINGTSLDLLKNNEKYERILIVIPTLENSGKELSLGLLPGSKEEKMSVYLDADTDTFAKILKHSGNLGCKQMIDNLVKCKKIDFEAVNYSLGKTWDNTIILLNEAENFNKQEMLLLISRLGENSKIIISGDILQCSRRSILLNKEECGLSYAMKKLCGMEEVGCVEFTKEDIVRNTILVKIIEKWND